MTCVCDSAPDLISPLCAIPLSLPLFVITIIIRLVLRTGLMRRGWTDWSGVGVDLYEWIDGHKLDTTYAQDRITGITHNMLTMGLINYIIRMGGHTYRILLSYNSLEC